MPKRLIDHRQVSSPL